MRRFPTECVSPDNARPQDGCGAVHAYREPNAMSVSESGGRTTRAAMTDGLEKAPSVYPAAHLMRETVWGEEALYASALKCFKGVGRKFSTQTYKLHLISNTVKLAREHRRGKYKASPPRVVQIEYPKKRTALSIAFRDRVTQRSINDLALYPQAVRRFVWTNFACQKGKGTDAAREYMKAMLRRAFLVYGSNDFKIVEVDAKGYYDNMRHDVTDAMFAKFLDPWTAAEVKKTLDRQYRGETGYNPGSQMVQIAGISYLDALDHHMKEVARRKMYVRYMDDMRIPARDGADVAHVLGEVCAMLAKVGLAAHPVKTRSVSAARGTVFLGFLFSVTPSGRVLVTREPKAVKANRRRLRRLAGKIRRGGAQPEALDESWSCMRSCMAKGRNRSLLRRMDDFVNSLKEEIHAETQYQTDRAA